jgi:serine phosphatase RsbU (regulator of sigma subunit)
VGASTGVTAALDGIGLDDLLAPWADAAPGLVVGIETPGGRRLAGPDHPGHDAGPRVTADVTVDGVLVARVVGSGPTSTADIVGPAIRTMAAAIERLLAERGARLAAERALREGRTAAALGIDDAELAKGRRQQRSILSLVAPDVPGYDLASYYAAAREIGGDFFELFRLNKRGRPLGIVIADVTGKGLDAALLMAFARPVMHAALNSARGPGDALSRTNRVLVDERRGTLFITALAAVLEPTTGQLRVGNAGHEPPLLVPADGGPVRAIGSSGLLLGAFVAIDPPETAIVLDHGDVLFLYTDGVTDAIDPTRQRFGDARLLATIEANRGRTAAELVTAVTDAVNAFQGEAEPADDVTIVAVGRQPARPRARPARARPARP